MQVRDSNKMCATSGIARVLGTPGRCEVYLLYWYKSTNTDRPLNQQRRAPPRACNTGAQFTCFTSTKVQILTQKTFLAARRRAPPRACNTLGGGGGSSTTEAEGARGGESRTGGGQAQEGGGVVGCAESEAEEKFLVSIDLFLEKGKKKPFVLRNPKSAYVKAA